jgi:UDP-N-acetylglucosamine 4,6-dehydratase
MNAYVPRRFDRPLVDLTGKSVLLTGGTGSFGRAFVKRALDSGAPRRLIVFSRDEQKQHVMERELESHPHAGAMRFFIGDVRDESRLELAMRGVDVVVHAAALKIVPTAEYNPFECVLTNIHGAENVVKASLRCGVWRVIALSTDKAANPINLYGATKLVSDKIFVAANNLAGDQDTRFAVVRYGNVIGSRGSVVPLFNELKALGASHLPITDERMTRFWITIDQGVSFVLSSLALMTGGEIFVPKIPSMRIVDLARHIAPGLPHQVTGIRPGEKLHEVMITEEDARLTVEIDDRYIIRPPVARFRRERRLPEEARPVAENFRYASDVNGEWLDAEALGTLLAGAPK